MFIPLNLMSLYLAQLRPGRTPAQCHTKRDYRPHGEELYWLKDRRRSDRRKCRRSQHSTSKPKCRRLRAKLAPSWCPPRRVWAVWEVI